MIIFKKQVFFAVPKSFNERDIEFDIFNSNGEVIGSNFMGISKNTSLTEEERFELEEIIQDTTMELEIELKFVKEYGVELKDWEKLSITKEEILDCMNNKWNIPEELIENLL